MRNLKKFLALVLAFVMAMSLMVTVNAASSDFADSEEINPKFAEAVEVLTGMGVFQGTDESGTLEFKPQSVVTRAQMAAVVYRLATGDAEDARAHLYSKYATFTDVNEDAWYAGYVGYCADAQIIAGYTDGSFKPNKSVTGYEALKMLLCAVGWGQNGEFEGSGWTIRVGTTATGEGLLGNVNSSTYEYTLNDPALREMLAEVTFQAAQAPTVVYQYGTYERYDNLIIKDADHLNPSLGVKFFGLSEHTGIIVGNQETGESNTIVAKTDKIPYTKGDAADKLTNAEYTPTGYEYPGTEVVDNTTLGAAGVGNSKNDNDENVVVAEALTFSGVSSGLDQYGHKVKIWYDNRAGMKNRAYSFVDLAKAVTVYAGEDSDANELNIADDTKGIGEAAKAAGFDMGKAADMQWSSEYSVFEKGDAVTSASAIHMYTLIDNTGNGKVDAIIRLNAEVAQITETNTTAKPKTVSLGGVTGTSSTVKGSATGTLFAEAVAGTNVNQILPGSTTTLGRDVIAWQVTGTYQDDAIAVKGYNKDVPDPQASDLWKLVSPLKEVTGTVASYKLDGDTAIESVTLSNGETYDRSGILEEDKAIAYWASHTALDGDEVKAGATYTIVLDSLGRFVDITTPNTFGFLYATYADFEVGPLGSGTIDYKVYGVDWNGKKVVDHDLTAMYLVDQDDDDATLASFDAANYGVGTGMTGTLGAGYASDDLVISKKDMATNAVTPGKNTAYMITDEGVMKDQYGFGGMDGIQMTNNDPDDVLSWPFKNSDAANGFVKVTNGDGEDYLVSSETEFIVVSGIGSNMVVKTYTGLKELLGDNTSAVITYDADAENGSQNEVWFMTEDYRYDSVDTGNSNNITKVILSAGNLKHYNMANLYFSATDNTAPTGVKLAGDADANQFKLWTPEGEKTYFLTNADLTEETFYTLSVNRETKDGVPIYDATAVTATTSPKLGRPGDGGDCNVDMTDDHELMYNYVVVNNLNKAEIGTDSLKDVFDVSNAVVVDMEYGITADKTSLNRSEIDSVLKLNNAVSTGYNVVVAIVNNGINVSTIYVVGVTHS